MGASKTTKVTKGKQGDKQDWVHKPRRATFLVKTEKGQRIFTPVNKRAHKLAVKVGKRTRVTAAELKQFKGYYKLCQYTDNGTLKTIKV